MDVGWEQCLADDLHRTVRRADTDCSADADSQVSCRRRTDRSLTRVVRRAARCKGECNRSAGRVADRAEHEGGDTDAIHRYELAVGQRRGGYTGHGANLIEQRLLHACGGDFGVGRLYVHIPCDAGARGMRECVSKPIIDRERGGDAEHSDHGADQGRPHCDARSLTAGLERHRGADADSHRSIVAHPSCEGTAGSRPSSRGP